MSRESKALARSRLSQSPDVSIRDMGFEKVIDRFMAVDGAEVLIGPRGKELQKIAFILEARYGWMTKLSAMKIDPKSPKEIDRVQDGIVRGRDSFRGIFERLGNWAVDEYQKQLLGVYGLQGGRVNPNDPRDQRRKPGLFDTGQLYRSIRAIYRRIPKT